MSQPIFSSSHSTLPPSVPSTLSPPPLPPPFGQPRVEYMALAFILLFFILCFFLLKIYNNRTYESDGGELLLETVEIEAPVFNYSGEKECVICLCGIEEGEKCRRMSTCGHVFHRDCIDQWLKVERHCPLCRTAVCVAVVRNTTASSPSSFLQPLWAEF